MPRALLQAHFWGKLPATMANAIVRRVRDDHRDAFHSELTALAGGCVARCTKPLCGGLVESQNDFPLGLAAPSVMVNFILQWVARSGPFRTTSHLTSASCDSHLMWVCTLMQRTKWIPPTKPSILCFCKRVGCRSFLEYGTLAR